MKLFNWLKSFRNRAGRRGGQRRAGVGQRSLSAWRNFGMSAMTVPPTIEGLEDRALLATITVTSLADNTTADGQVTLREAIQAANADAAVDGSTAGSGADTITFAASLFSGGDQTINLSTVGDTTFGPSALAITSAITISGPSGNNGLTIARDSSVANLRLFVVSSAGNLTLENSTLSGGTHIGGNGGGSIFGGVGGGAAGLGGAIFNQGTLSIQNSTLVGNRATGGNGGSAGVANVGGGGGGGGLNGSGQTASSEMGATGGGPNGGFGGFPGQQGGNGGAGGGGGGAGGQGSDRNGGIGGFGGGGGGGGADFSDGGRGGFGGGGGSTGYVNGNGGQGGFGGGTGGRGFGSPAQGSGGGGAGLGGAVFNHGGDCHRLQQHSFG